MAQLHLLVRALLPGMHRAGRCAQLPHPPLGVDVVGVGASPSTANTTTSRGSPLHLGTGISNVGSSGTSQPHRSAVGRVQRSPVLGPGVCRR